MTGGSYVAAAKRAARALELVAGGLSIPKAAKAVNMGEERLYALSKKKPAGRICELTGCSETFVSSRGNQRFCCKAHKREAANIKRGASTIKRLTPKAQQLNYSEKAERAERIIPMLELGLSRVEISRRTGVAMSVLERISRKFNSGKPIIFERTCQFHKCSMAFRTINELQEYCCDSHAREARRGRNEGKELKIDECPDWYNRPTVAQRAALAELPPETRARWLRNATASVALLVLGVHAAHAHDMNGVDYGSWLRADGSSCCSARDCGPAEPCDRPDGTQGLRILGHQSCIAITSITTLIPPCSGDQTNNCNPNGGFHACVAGGNFDAASPVMICRGEGAQQ